MLLKQAAQKEALRNQNMIVQYEQLAESLPKGSLIRKNTGYYSLEYREEGKIRDKYIGKNKAVIDEMEKKISLRRHCEQMLKALRAEQKSINKVLEGLR